MTPTVLPTIAERLIHDRLTTVADADAHASSIAAAIGEPARARILYCLMDGRARTSTELAVVAEVSPSTASTHLQRLRSQDLVRVFAQGKHRYYSLASAEVAATLEALSVLALRSRTALTPTTPPQLRAARTCYDHIAGRLGVLLHDRLATMRWLTSSYEITPEGDAALRAMGIDLDAARTSRRRFTFPCLDWSERRPHLAGAFAAALLALALKRKWVVRDLDSRILSVTHFGQRELWERFGLKP